MTIERERPADVTTVFDPSGADEFDDEYLLDEDGDDEDGRPRPAWLHPNCLNACLALEVGTCCKNPDNRLVAVAVDLADLVDQSFRRLGNVECEGPDAELAYRLKLTPGLLAQIHAILPRLNPTAVAQLLCPVGRLADAIDRVRTYGCPCACENAEMPKLRPEYAHLAPLLSDCLVALRGRLGWPLP
jgi:hypothetical protein